MKNILFFVFLYTNLVFSQTISSKIYIQDEYWYLVKTENSSGILMENHLDSLISLKKGNFRFIDINALDRFNHSEVNFDFYDSCVYALSSIYLTDSYSSDFYKIPLNEMDTVNEVNTKFHNSRFGIGAKNYKFYLSANSSPIRRTPAYYFPPDSIYSLFYDLTYADNSNLKFFIFNDKTKKLDYWNFYGHVERRICDRKPSNLEPRWELTHSYDVEDGISQNFCSVVIQGKVYIITHEGIVYLANEELRAVEKLPDNLDNGFIAINKEKGEVAYLYRSEFDKEGKTMRMLLKDAIKIGL